MLLFYEYGKKSINVSFKIGGFEEVLNVSLNLGIHQL